MFSPQRCQLWLRNILAIAGPQRSPNISTSCVTYESNHYQSLGIPKNSTQGEIKAAYYRLSMIYHPDKNQGSESAAIKFREITQAYEVLSNFRLRRLYDKGIIHTAGPQYEQKTPHDVSHDTDLRPEDDPTTKFYKSRFKKSKVADSEGRTPIYNFDEWTRHHYGKTFERRQTAKAKYDRTKTQEISQKLFGQTEILLISLTILCSISYFMFVAESSYDAPKERAIKSALEKKLNDEKSS